MPRAVDIDKYLAQEEELHLLSSSKCSSLLGQNKLLQLIVLGVVVLVQTFVLGLLLGRHAEFKEFKSNKVPILSLNHQSKTFRDWKYEDAIYKLTSHSSGSSSVGTAWSIGYDKGSQYLLTVAHVVSPNPDYVSLTNARQDSKSVEVIAIDAKRDLALLRTTSATQISETLNVVPIGAFKTPLLVRISGYPHGQFLRLESRLKGQLEIWIEGFSRRPFWELTTPAPKGMSGAPVVTPTGDVIGVYVRSGKHSGLCVTSNDLRAFLKEQGFAWLL